MILLRLFANGKLPSLLGLTHFLASSRRDTRFRYLHVPHQLDDTKHFNAATKYCIPSGGLVVRRRQFGRVSLPVGGVKRFCGVAIRLSWALHVVQNRCESVTSLPSQCPDAHHTEPNVPQFTKASNVEITPKRPYSSPASLGVAGTAVLIFSVALRTISTPPCYRLLRRASFVVRRPSLVHLHSYFFLGSFCFHLWRGKVVHVYSITQPERRTRIRQLFFSEAETPVLWSR